MAAMEAAAAAARHGRRIALWEVDVQADFMLPGGKLYVPGAQRLIPRIQDLIQAAERRNLLIVSSADAHAEDDREFEKFPPHCVAGSPGAQIIPEGLAARHRAVPNGPAARLPRDLSAGQLILEKQALDVFTNPLAGKLVERLGARAEYIVFGVTTEYCVRCAALGLLARGRKLSLVRDAIQALDAEAGAKALDELAHRGAQFISAAEALARMRAAEN